MESRQVSSIVFLIKTSSANKQSLTKRHDILPRNKTIEGFTLEGALWVIRERF